MKVVRCTACSGMSQVEAEAIGLTVQCPHCCSTFAAIEHAEPTPIPRASRNPTLPPPAPPEPRRDRPRRRLRERDRGRERNRDREPRPAPEHDHDPHHTPSEPLPASVLIGLALLPFAIPIFWLVAPAVVGREPAMSIATPSALAISASVLCLAVIYTVDWTPTTRIKGVLMLVGLAYFSAVSLYFVKKGIVEKFQRFTGLEEKVEWQELKREHYKVLMPGPPREVPAEESPLQTLVKLNCVEADHEKKWFGEYRFVVGSAKLADQVNANGPKPGTKAWFEAALGEVESRFGGKKSGGVRRVEQQGHQGPQWEIRKVPTGPTRLVRLFVIRGRVYYLSVEGQHLQPNDILVQSFFRSLDIEHAND